MPKGRSIRRILGCIASRLRIHPVNTFAFASAASILLLLASNVAMATEEPPFTLVVDDGAFQIRQYPPLTVAETEVTGTRRAASSTGFRILADYIFGRNTRRERIAMTAPVSQSPPTGEKIAMTAPVSQTGTGEAWVIQFTMPAGYTLDTLPTPNDPRVVLRVTPATRVAVIRFAGWAGDSDFERKRTELERWMAQRKLRAAGPAVLAQYDPPWTLGPLRRNEVMFPIEGDPAR